MNEIEMLLRHIFTDPAMPISIALGWVLFILYKSWSARRYLQSLEREAERRLEVAKAMEQTRQEINHLRLQMMLANEDREPEKPKRDTYYLEDEP